jgi:hypothetical protein
MSDERSIYKAQLIVNVQIALNVGIGIFELHLREGWWLEHTLRQPMQRRMYTYWNSRIGDFLKNLEARLPEDSAHRAGVAISQGYLASLLSA